MTFYQHPTGTDKFWYIELGRISRREIWTNGIHKALYFNNSKLCKWLASWKDDVGVYGLDFVTKSKLCCHVSQIGPLHHQHCRACDPWMPSNLVWGDTCVSRDTLRAGSHGVLSPPSLTWAQSVQSQPLRTRKLGLTTSHGVSSHESQVWHGCLPDNIFWRGGEARDLCWELGLAKFDFFCDKIRKSEFNNNLSCFNDFLRL